MYLKAKEELWKLKYFTMQKYNLQKNPLEKTQNPSRYYNSITNPMQLIQRVFVKKQTPKSLDFMENIFEIVKVGQYVPSSCQNIFRF
jgi:hypothetical protein